MNIALGVIIVWNASRYGRSSLAAAIVSIVTIGVHLLLLGQTQNGTAVCLVNLYFDDLHAVAALVFSLYSLHQKRVSKIASVVSLLLAISACAFAILSASRFL
jgi:hypothetical protein